MKYVLALLLSALCISTSAQALKKTFKFATFYTAFSGGNSIADDNVYSVTSSLQTDVISTPFDYSFTAGVRKIARFGYENRASKFYDGSEKSYGDAATIGKIKGFEFLFEADYQRQRGQVFLDQNHFLRYVGDNMIVKVEYLQDGFADVKYFEASQRARVNINKKLSLNIGVVERLSESYGYDPLQEWMLSNGNLHYTTLAIQEGYTVNVQNSVYYEPNGDICAESSDVWEQIIIPEILDEYVDRKISDLGRQLQLSCVVGADYYHYSKDFWAHAWVNAMPYHLDNNNEFSYFQATDGNQWVDYSGGLIFGWKLNKSLGVFLEGKYNKYWNREWHDFSVGLNYVIL
tara:strand:+ start:236 stop:1273 length:1038 start_codon:yes stop_codon:yes gene_type:complete